MPFILNDKTYWKRYKQSHKVFLKVFIPIYIVNFLLWYLIEGREIKVEHLLLGALSTTLVLFTFINLFKQYPNHKIPDTYPAWGKNLMYLGQFLVACFGLYITFAKIIYVT